jgi:hypothetical protein
MLSTIMISLLCIWLAIMIIGQLISGVVAYSIYRTFKVAKK